VQTPASARHARSFAARTPAQQQRDGIMSESPKANWNYPTSVKFGAGRVKELPQHLAAAGIKRPLIVTDAVLAGLPMLRDIRAMLDEVKIEFGVFHDVKPNPTESNVYAGLEVLRAGKHDGVIALGGGSPLDAGKVIAFMAGQTRKMWDFEDVGDWWTRAKPDGIAPVIAIPTTAGTGSEVGRAGVITQEKTHTKKVIFHPGMMPKVTICDPDLTVGMPAKITAGTGMDALAHCFEAFCAPGYHPLADGIAVEGMRLVKEYLPRAYRDGKDIEARAHMMSAAAMGATAFQKGLGAIHSLSHPVGAFYDTHHGMTNALFFPYVMQFNRSQIREKMVRLAAYLGLKKRNYAGMLDWIMALREELGVPHDLPAFKVDDKRFAEMAKMAPKDPTAGGNPRKLTAGAALTLYRKAYEGKV
jgi:alcohol dehydrogenase class IV